MLLCHFTLNFYFFLNHSEFTKTQTRTWRRWWHWFQLGATEGGLLRFKMFLWGMSARKKNENILFFQLLLVVDFPHFHRGRKLQLIDTVELQYACKFNHFIIDFAAFLVTLWGLNIFMHLSSAYSLCSRLWQFKHSMI